MKNMGLCLWIKKTRKYIHNASNLFVCLVGLPRSSGLHIGSLTGGKFLDWRFPLFAQVCQVSRFKSSKKVGRLLMTKPERSFPSKKLYEKLTPESPRFEPYVSLICQRYKMRLWQDNKTCLVRLCLSLLYFSFLK